MAGLLNTIFIVCLALAIVFFIITIVLFFLFDIRTIFNIRSGKAAAKTVKEMETANASTGRLRVGKVTNTGTLDKKQGKSKKLKTKTQTFGVPTPPDVIPQQGPITEDITTHPVTPERLSDDNQTELLSEQTQLLGHQNRYPKEPENTEPAEGETELLHTDADVASPVPQTVEDKDTSVQEQKYDDIRFEIVKMIILCDTDEVII